MSSALPPAEIAREALMRLSSQRIPPTPTHFAEVYYEIAGEAYEEAFPTRALRPLIAALPRGTPGQLQAAQRLEAACVQEDWNILRETLLTRYASDDTPPAWGALIRDLLAQAERRQAGLSSSTKHEGLSRVLEGSSDPALLFSRLQGLVRGWAQLPGELSVATPELSLPEAPEQWRQILADVLDSATGLLLDDMPELAREAGALAATLREPLTAKDDEEFTARLRQFSYKIEWVAQDQRYMRNALLGLLRLVVENIGELVLEDRFMQGQMELLGALFTRPLDKPLVEELGERLRDVISQQGSLKRNLNEAQDKLRRMLALFVDQLGELAQTTGVYHGKVESFAARITQAASLDELAGLVDEISRETAEVERRTRASQTELQALRGTVDQAQREITRLEGELAQASELVRHDPLTGTLNRKGLDEMLKREMARHERRRTPLCLALLDVDDFKRLNDSLGHLTGDDALRHFAAVIRESVRPQDSVARYGGEEFLILLPDTTLEDAQMVLQRLQRELTRRIFLHDNQRVLITFSAGVACVGETEEADAALARADQAMYQAKASGKNRVIAL